MPTKPPAETSLEIRSAATVNTAALDQVSAIAIAHLAEVATWDNSPAKGLVRDALERVLRRVDDLQDSLAQTIRASNMVLAMFGQGGQPNPPVPGANWWSPDHLHASFGSVGRPAPGAEFGRYLSVEPVEVSQALSAAVSATPASAQSVLAVTLEDDTPVATFTWAIGATEAVVDVQLASIEPGNILIFTAPTPQDLTLSGITATLVLIR